MGIEMVTNPILGFKQFYQQLLVIEIISYPFKRMNRFFDKVVKINGMTEVETGNVP